MNIAVLVSGGGTNLQALIDNGLAPWIKVVVSSKEGAFALERASKAGISTVVISDGAELVHFLDSNNIDLVVLAGYMKILKGEVLEKYDRRIINVHPSLIPSFCGEGMYGLRVHEAALEKGVKVTGATVHYVNDEVDGGDIIAQKAVEVREGDTAVDLQKRVMEEAEWVILPSVVKSLIKETN